ncbi:hypothetical protein Tco_0046131 [Tanacetum coccineum]
MMPRRPVPRPGTKYHQVASSGGVGLTAEEFLGHALGRAVEFGMQEGLEAGHEHGVAGRSLSLVDAYNPEAARASYVDSVKALEDEQASLGEDFAEVIKRPVDETSLSFVLDECPCSYKGAKKHVAALRQLMMEIVSAPLSSQTWMGEASTSATPLSVEDYTKEDTDEAWERCCRPNA